jgi:hypothetical protein
MSALVTPPRPAPNPPVARTSRWAWCVLLLSPVLCVLAVWMSFFVLGDENINWWGELIVGVMVLAPPVAAALLGVRAARSGNRLGTHAAAVAGGWLTFLIMFWYAANYPYNGDSAVVPVTLGIISALLVAAAVESVCYWLVDHHDGTTRPPSAAR